MMMMTQTTNPEKSPIGALQALNQGIRVILADSQAIYRVGMKKVFAARRRYPRGRPSGKPGQSARSLAALSDRRCPA